MSLNVVLLPRPLRYGAGSTLAGLCAAVAGLDRPEVTLPGCGLQLVGQQHAELERFVYLLTRTAARNPPCSPLYFVLAVPGAGGGLADPDRHLICGRLAPAATSRLRDAALANGALLVPTMDDIAPDSPIEWCTVSEEREAVVTRRDSRRPASAYLGLHVVLWGCGGIGSWVGEFLARAGAARITLCDPATITGGLLVRQDYTEEDIGASKADALARRLAVIRDDLVVDVVPEAFRLLEGASLPDCDLLVDATVSNAVAHCLGLVWYRSGPRPLVGRMSTDRATSTLGLLTVTRPGAGPTPEETDRQTGAAVHGDPALESYRCFWETASPGDEVVPEPGCSVPTFHGSAADLASVAGTLLSLLGPHLQTSTPMGSHLVGLPHSDAGLVGHRWVGVRDGEGDGPGPPTSTTS